MANQFFPGDNKMSLVDHRQKIELPDRMRSKLESFQRRVWMVKLAEGILAAFFGLLVSYLLVFILDRFIDTSAVVRGAILLIGSLGLGLWFPLVCHKWVWKSRRLEQVARLLKYKFPRLGDHMLGIIELVNNPHEHNRSEQLCRAALAQVDEETKDKNFDNAVPRPKHKRWALIAGIPAAIVILALLLVPAAGFNAFARWLMPWKHTERYTFAQMKPLPEKIVVPHAEKSTFKTELSDSTRWSPKKGKAKIDGVGLFAENNEGKFEFTLPPISNPSKLKVYVGDARHKIEIDPQPRPEITSIQADIELPAYLQRSQNLNRDVRGGSVTIVEGAKVAFKANASRDIVSATVDGKSIQTKGQWISTKHQGYPESKVLQFNWRDSLDLTPKTPLNLKVRVEPDAAPLLTCTKITKEQVVLEKDVLVFNVIAEDDFGVKTIGMEWKGVPQEGDIHKPIVGSKVVSAGSPEATELEVVATFSPTRENVKPQVIELRLFTTDYLPNREKTYSPTYRLYVLSEEEHAIWLTRRLDKWFKQSLETYEAEQRLFKDNVRIRNLPKSELDTKKVREQIRKQAALEAMQARRLDALTQLGEAIAKEATRNDQFNVATLEKLAEMLQALKDISGKRMPSISDLLKKAANAKSAGAGTPANPQKTPPNINASKGESAKGKGKGKSSKLPSINMQESSMDSKKKGDEKKGDEKESKGKGKFTLPSVTLKDNSPDKPQEGGDSPAQEQMEEVVDEHEKLLAEFQKVAEELKKILNNLEGSTFVKRLKAMSRRQTEIAQDLNDTSLGSFGESLGDVKPASKKRFNLLSKRQDKHSTTTTHIQDDLEAYANRVNEGKFKTVLSEMKKEDVIKQLKDVSAKIVSNESGGSIAHSEFLADTLDRWAEQLVGPG